MDNFADPNEECKTDLTPELKEKQFDMSPSSNNRMGPVGRSDECIQFAAFLSDFDPTLLFMLTYSAERHVSYLKVLKIEKKEEARSYSVYEEQDRKEVMANVKTNLYENEAASRAPMFSDNYAITLDQHKQQMKVVKRGQGTVKMTAAIPEIGMQKRLQNRGLSP